MDERATGALLLWGERLPILCMSGSMLMILLSAVRMPNTFSVYSQSNRFHTPRGALSAHH